MTKMAALIPFQSKGKKFKSTKIKNQINNLFDLTEMAGIEAKKNKHFPDNDVNKNGHKVAGSKQQARKHAGTRLSR